jgi:hypothetical protein
VKMPWGKYRGLDLMDVPSSYLVWVSEECSQISPFLRRAVVDELADRFGRPCPICLDLMSGPPREPAIPAALVDAWYRQLALRHHPDRGGLPGAMVGVNAARDLLLDMLGRNRP